MLNQTDNYETSLNELKYFNRVNASAARISTLISAFETQAESWALFS